MSVKQWSSYQVDASYHDILALREDAWLGISRKANGNILLLAIALFAPVITLAAVRRTTLRLVASVVSGVALVAACIAWAMLVRV